MLNLGSLEFTLGINTRSLDEAYRRVESFGKAVQLQQTRANNGKETLIGSYRRIENSILSAGEALNNFIHKVEMAKVSPQVKADLIKQAEASYAALTERATEFKKVTDNTNLDRSMAKFKNDLGDVNRSLGHIVREENEAVAAAKKLEGAMGGVGTSASKTEAALTRQANTLAAAEQRARNLSQTIGMADLGGKKGANTQLDDRVQAQFAALRSALSGPEPLKPREFSAAVNTYKAGIGEITRDLKQLKADAIAPVTENFNQLKRTLGNLGSSMLLINGHLGGMSTRLIALSTLSRDFSGIWVGVIAGITGASLAITGLVKASLTAGMKIQEVEKSLEAVTGSAAVAATQLKFLVTVANRSGNSYTDLAKNYASFTAAAVSSGQGFAETQHQFETFAMAAGKLSLPIDKTRLVFLALEQMMSKGTVSSEELRRQLGDNLYGAFSLAAEAMGVTTAELQGMLKSGELLTKDFLPKFTEQVRKAFNIDATPIATLRASLGRLTTSSDLFFAAFAKNTRLMDAASFIVEKLAGAINYLTKNMDTIIDTVLKLSGAFAAAAAAWGAFALAAVTSGTVTALVGGLMSAVAAIRAATAGTIAWAAAIKALDIAWMTAGIGRVVTFVLKLTAVLGSAVAGYYLTEKALASMGGGLEDNAAMVDQYIKRQKAMGFQIRETTNDLIAQQRALLITESANLKTLNAERNRQKKNAGEILPFGLLTRVVDPEITNQVVAATQRVRDLVKQMDELGQIAQLPEMGSGPGVAAIGEEAKKTKEKVDQAAKAIKDLITEYQRSEDMLEAMIQGPQALVDLENLHAAQDAIADFTDSDLAKADAALTAIGLSTGTVTERLAALIGKTTSATDAVDAYRGVWEDAQTAMRETIDLQEQVEALLGGASAEKMDSLTNFQKAMESIRDLSPEAISALLAQIQGLTGAIIVAVDPAAALAAAIADIWDQGDKADRQVQALSGLRDALRDMADDTAENAARIEGMHKGLSDENLDRWVRSTMLIREWKRELENAGVPAEEAKVKIAELQEGLERLEASEIILEWAEQWKDFKDGAARALAETVGAVARDFDNIGELARGLVDRLIDMFTEMFVIEPLFQMLQSLMNGGTGGIGQSKAGGGFAGLLSGLLGGIVGTNNDPLHKLKTAGGWFPQGEMKGFSQGGGNGLLNGVGTNSSDSMLARVSDDEFIMDASATRRWGAGNLAALNQGMNPWAGSSRSTAPIQVTVKVEGARGNAEIKAMAHQGTMEALKQYDRNVGERAQSNFERYS
jgi:tape measure domain-containing protein